MAQRSRELNSLLSRFSDGVLATSSRRRETIAGAAAIVAPLLCRKVAADHSPIAVEQAMREAVDVQRNATATAKAPSFDCRGIRGAQTVRRIVVCMHGDH
jgi:hypothetical protein